MRMPAKEIYKAGLEAFTKKQYKDAIIHFNQLAQEKHDNEAYFWLGNAYFAKKDYDMAFLYLEMAKDYQPTGQENYCNKRKHYAGDSSFYLAKIANLQGNSKKAMDFIQEAIRLDENPHYPALKAGFHVKQGQFMEAIDAYKNAIQICDRALDKVKKPVKYADVIQKYKDLNIRYYLKLVDILTQIKKPTEAYNIELVRCYNKLAKLQPEKVAHYKIKMARKLEVMHDLKSAISVWNEVFEHHNTPELRYEASRVCRKQIEQIQNVQDVKTEDDIARDQFHEMDVNALVKQQYIDNLKTQENLHLQAAISQEMQLNDGIRGHLAREFYRNVQAINADKIPSEKRMETYKNYLNDYPNHKDGLYYLGHLYFLEGARSEALVQFLKVLKIDPKHKPTLNSLFDTIRALNVTDKLPQVDMEVLYAAMKTYPKKIKRWMANELLNESSPLGFYFLQSKAADKDKIQELIHLFPAGKRRNAWLEVACRSKTLSSHSTQNLLFTIVQTPRPEKSRVTGSVREALNQEYAESIKYKIFAGYSVHKGIADHAKIQNMEPCLPKNFDPAMLGQMLRQFYKVAAALYTTKRFLQKDDAPESSPHQLPNGGELIYNNFQKLIQRYSCEEILMAIQAPAIPGAEKVSVVKKADLLLACLDPETILGEKFLVDGNKKNVYKVVKALPEKTVDEITQKRNFYNQIRTKEGSRLYKLFQQADSLFGIGTISVNSGTMKDVYDEETRLESLLPKATNLQKNSMFAGNKAQDDSDLQEWSRLEDVGSPVELPDSDDDTRSDSLEM